MSNSESTTFLENIYILWFFFNSKIEKKKLFWTAKIPLRSLLSFSTLKLEKNSWNKLVTTSDKFVILYQISGLFQWHTTYLVLVQKWVFVVGFFQVWTCLVLLVLVEAFFVVDLCLLFVFLDLAFFPLAYCCRTLKDRKDCNCFVIAFNSDYLYSSFFTI